jgi:hypothetical protein
VPYRLTFSPEDAATATFHWRYTPGITLGFRFFPEVPIILEMGASKALFVYHDHASVAQNINCGVEPIE